MASKNRKIVSLLFAWLFPVMPGFTSDQPARNETGTSYRLRKVVIDAGHGGHDPGCMGSKSREKDVTLAIALKAGKFIEDNITDVTVVYTRKTDVFLELHQRAAIANNAKADLFISIHCNAACFRDKKKRKDVCNESTAGAETWVMGLHKTEANLEVAKRENEVVLLESEYQKRYDGFDPNSPEANIIFSLYQNEYLERSLKMATFIQDEMKKRDRINRGVKQAGFLVLFKTYMPSVLLETGFLSNPEEERFLGSEKGQTAVASSIYNAFKSYKQAIEQGTIETSVTENETKAKPDNDRWEEKTEVKDSVKEQSQVSENIYKPKPTDKTSEALTKDTVDAIRKQTIRTVDKEDKKMAVEKPPPSKPEYYFSVQVATSSSPLKLSNPIFRGESNIREEQDNNLYKYLSGKLQSFEEAFERQTQLRNKGFKDCFVVGYINGKRTPANVVREAMNKPR